MKKLIATISLFLSCISIFNFTNSLNNTTTETTNNNIVQSLPKNSPVPKTDTQNFSKTRETNQLSSTKIAKQPQVGTVTELVNGDLLCYVTLIDEKGKESIVGASFDICAKTEKFLNKKVRNIYTIESVNDCESSEPCGKTRQQSIITKMEVWEDKSRTKTPDSKTQMIGNGEWIITIGNADSWKGVNNTGNLTYQGCDADGKCIELTGGKVSCRDGRCVTGWKNGEYIYILEQPITEDGNSPQTLIVKKGKMEILKVTGLKNIRL